MKEARCATPSGKGNVPVTLRENGTIYYCKIQCGSMCGDSKVYPVGCKPQIKPDEPKSK